MKYDFHTLDRHRRCLLPCPAWDSAVASKEMKIAVFDHPKTHGAIYVIITAACI